MKCYYHSADYDGHCGGAIVKFKYPKCQMYPSNYGREIKTSNIGDGETIFIVDFSIPVETVKELLSRQVRIKWIDHHASAIKEYDEAGLTHLDGLRDITKSGCELAWEFLFPYQEMPKLVRNIGRYDVWDHTDPEVIPLQYGLQFEKTNPKDSMDLWNIFLLEDTDPLVKELKKDIYKGILDKGLIIEEYVNSSNERICKSSFECEIDGYKALALNATSKGSLTFKSIWNPEVHDLMILYKYTKDKWYVSLYSEEGVDIDVSIIAKKFNGGGHRYASGLIVKNLQIITEDDIKPPFSNDTLVLTRITPPDEVEEQ